MLKREADSCHLRKLRGSSDSKHALLEARNERKEGKLWPTAPDVPRGRPSNMRIAKSGLDLEMKGS